MSCRHPACEQVFTADTRDQGQRDTHEPQAQQASMLGQPGCRASGQEAISPELPKGTIAWQEARCKVDLKWRAMCQHMWNGWSGLIRTMPSMMDMQSAGLT